MESQTIKDIIPKLEEVAKYVHLKRKKLKEEIRQSLFKLDDGINVLQRHKNQMETENNRLLADKQKQKNELKKIYGELKELSKQRAEQTSEIEKKAQEKLLLEEGNARLLATKEKFELVSSLLSSKPSDNEEWRDFQKVFHQDFFDFANNEDSLANEAEAVLRLQAIEKELEIIINFSAIFNKNIIAIGGGFSSGKSAFINSFFLKPDIKLPVGIKPVTAIPTYVVYSQNNEIKGYQNNGGCTAIASGLYKKLSHDFVKSFNFNLKTIMPFMTIGTPVSFEKEVPKSVSGIKILARYSHVWAWDGQGESYFICNVQGRKMKKEVDGWKSFHFKDRKKINCRFSNYKKSKTKDFHIAKEGEYYFENGKMKQANTVLKKLVNPLKNICFIDTPGYNPSDTGGFTKYDVNTAKEYLEQANSLLWMIGLDAHGTIPTSDLNFLEGLDLWNKKLFIIANKADVRPLSDVKKVLEEIAETLDDYDIHYEGISAFSANRRREYHFIKKSIFDFLVEENNHSIQIKEEIIEKINAVLDLYKDAIKQDINVIKRSKIRIKSLELDLLEIAYDEDNPKIEERLYEMKQTLNVKELEKQLKELEKLREKFEKSVRNIFANLSRNVSTRSGKFKA